MSPADSAALITRWQRDGHGEPCAWLADWLARCGGRDLVFAQLREAYGSGYWRGRSVPVVPAGLSSGAGLHRERRGAEVLGGQLDLTGVR